MSAYREPGEVKKEKPDLRRKNVEWEVRPVDALLPHAKCVEGAFLAVFQDVRDALLDIRDEMRLARERGETSASGRIRTSDPPLD